MGKLRILIVEDERIIASDIKETLTSLGYAVVGIADTGEQAIQKAGELSPDVILMDVMLKGSMSGIDAAGEIKKESQIPIIYLTSYADSDTIQKAKITEPFGYIVKPFSEKELHTTIEMAAYKHKADQKLKESEKRYRELYDNSPDGLVTTSADLRIIHCNKRMKDMLESSDQTIEGCLLSDYFSGEYSEKFRKEHEKLLRKGVMLNFKAEMTTAKNKKLFVAVNSSAVLNPEGQLLEVQTAIKDISALKILEDENLMLSEKVIKLSRKIPLTDNEKNVLFGIISYPLMNDVELSKILKIKRSTVTSIKNKLQREQYFTSLKIPNLALLGCELLTIFQADIGHSVGSKEKINEIAKELSHVDEIFYLNCTEKAVVGLCASKNFTELRSKVIYLLDEFEESGLLEGSMVKHFNLDLCKIENFFDYSKIISSIFELGNPKRKINKISSHTKLTTNEKSIFEALVSSPALNDSELAEETGIPRPSISQARKKLITQGYLDTLNVPNLIQIRHELLNYKHVQIGKTSSNECCNRIIGKLKNLPSTIFLVEQDREFYAISLFNDYSESDYEHAEMDKFTAGANCKIRNEFSKLIPITQIKYSKLDFSGILRHMLKQSK